MAGETRGEERRKPVAPVSWGRRIGWFVALWAGSILMLGLVAYAIRAMIL